MGATAIGGSAFGGALRAGARAFGGMVLDALLPPECLTCDQRVAHVGQFCAACFRLTGFITAPYCGRCATPFLYPGQLGRDDGGDPVCGNCLVSPPPWTRARAALRYDEQARRLILPFKHGDRLEFARPLARMMARAGAALLREADLIVPVPLHRGRLCARRYNQSALLAGCLSSAAGRRAALDGLVRLRATPSLGTLGRAARAEAVTGAFSVRDGRRASLAGARVLLVDDVLTSGATATACAEILLAAGCRAVDLLVVARVPDPGSS